jgi:hypothetical protein
MGRQPGAGRHDTNPRLGNCRGSGCCLDLEPGSTINGDTGIGGLREHRMGRCLPQRQGGVLGGTRHRHAGHVHCVGLLSQRNIPALFLHFFHTFTGLQAVGLLIR